MFGMAFMRHDVYGWDGIGDAILEKEGDKCAEGIYNKANNNKINGYEDLRASLHCKYSKESQEVPNSETLRICLQRVEKFIFRMCK
jgi:hypothetical protein